MLAEYTIRKLAYRAGVTINGSELWDPQVHNTAFYKRLLREGSLGLGNSYVEGWWDVEDLATLMSYLLAANIRKLAAANPYAIVAALQARVINLQSRSRAYEVGKKHYDIGNDFYRAMLGSTMAYSCGYWPDGITTLEEAQTAKLDLICRKLQLKPGMRLLDIGCGWGSLLAYAARHYQVQGLGVTISVEQAKLARQRCLGLPVEIEVMDYRLLTGEFDAIASVGMFEHVGFRNYRTFMRVAERLLVDYGCMLLHTIGGNQSVRQGDRWLNEHIFPNSMLPSIEQIGQASAGLLVMENWQNFGPDYVDTLMAWLINFKEAWPQLSAEQPERYTTEFYRMWSYYLLSCAGVFSSRTAQLWQVVFSKHFSERYDPVY